MARARTKPAPAKRAPAKRVPAKAKRVPAKRAPAKRAPAKRAAAKSKAPPRKRAARVEFAREPGLEAAVIEAPLDPLPRFVYGDWLQSIGEKRGEWVTLSAGVEADPKNARLRAAAVEFLDNHRVDLLGGGAPLLQAGWIGWRCGFVDELRVQPYEKQRTVLPAFAALLAHPSGRFVRHIALGGLPNPQGFLDTLAAAAPPLLETLLMFDQRYIYANRQPSVDHEAFDSLRGFGCHGVSRTRPLPKLVELHAAPTDDVARWLAQPFPELAEITFECASGWQDEAFVVGILKRMPALRRLRFVNLRQADQLATTIAPHVGGLELLDLSHSDLTDEGASRLFGAPRLRLLALRTAVTPAMSNQLQDQLAGAVVSNPSSTAMHYVYDETAGESWPAHRLRTDGRDSLRLVPAVGVVLNWLGVNHTNRDNDALAAPLLEATVSLPAPELHTWPWASAAFSYEKLGRYYECELIAREGLLHAPRETNFYAFILYALRRTGRSAEAVRLVPRVEAALHHAKTERQTNGARACLVSVITTLAQAGEHAQALALYKTHKSVADPNTHACAAMSNLALGKHAAARELMKRAAKVKPNDEFTLQPRRRAAFHHATAVMELAAGKRAEALAAIALAQKNRYYDVHWLASDPNLAALHADPAFVEILARPVPAKEPTDPTDD